MAAPRLFFLFCSVLVINQILYVQGTTPFCELCPCNSKPNTPPNINCISANVDDIYDDKLWFDDCSNTSYPILSLVIKFNNLNVLQTQFPASDLKMLDLSNNSIAKLGTGIFSQLQNLSELVLGNNDIEWIDPDVFKGVYYKEEYYPLRSLKTLDLRHNKLHTLDGDVFEHIDELEVLNLSNNPFTEIDSQTVTAIASLVSLRVLDLSYNQLKTLPDNFMHIPEHLVILDLSGNNFESIPQALAESHALQRLYLNSNPIRSLAAPNVFQNISTLKELHMSQMPILHDIGAHALSGLVKLEKLYLSDNKDLTFIDPMALIKQEGDKQICPPIVEIFMENNNISYLDSQTVLLWKNIKQLDLRGNPWSCDCENQWIIDELIPMYNKINTAHAQELTCKYPIEMEGKTLYDLSRKNSQLRCLDLYDHRPENDALLLIISLSASLTAVLVFMFVVYIYRTKKLHLGPDAGGPQYTRV